MSKTNIVILLVYSVFLTIVLTLLSMSCKPQTEPLDRVILKTKYPPSREFVCTRSSNVTLSRTTTYICEELPLP